MRNDVIYTYKVWAKDYVPFIDARLRPVFKCKEGKSKWLYAFWGHYHKHYHAAAIAADKVMLERSGFRKVELIQVEM